MEDRTLEDFVEDMVQSGRDLTEIRAVALCSHWSNKMDEITVYAKNLLENKKKKGKKR
jgi:hypothetical protein